MDILSNVLSVVYRPHSLAGLLGPSPPWHRSRQVTRKAMVYRRLIEESHAGGGDSGVETSRIVSSGAATITTSSAPPGEVTHLIGQVLRQTYRIVELLDEGGMGKVFTAEHVRLNRRVAVKVLAKHLAGHASAFARFRREAEIISQLHHPHIVHVLDFDTTPEGEPYIVMEYLHGESLAARLDRERLIPLGDVVQIVGQIASGLDTAHRAGVVHRDLKPGNVFLLEMPDRSCFVKLLDFGISKVAGGPTRVTQEFDVLGTPDYMAPEQAVGNASSVDHRADQFAVAVMAYEMLSSRMPFEGDSVTDVLNKVIREPPLPLSEAAPLVSRQVCEVITRALGKNPGERFTDMTEFAAALAQASGLMLSLPPYSKAPYPYSHAPAVPTVRPAATPAESARRSVRPRVPIVAPHANVDVALDTSVEDVRRELERVRRSLAFAESTEAYLAAHAVMRAAFSRDRGKAREIVQASAKVLEAIFEQRLRGPRGRILLRQLPDLADAEIAPQQVYLLTRLEDSSTLDEVLDLSPLSRLETMWLLAGCLDNGLIGVG